MKDIVENIIKRDGLCFVDVYFPKTAGLEYNYILKNMDQFQSMFDEYKRTGPVYFVFKKNPIIYKNSKTIPQTYSSIDDIELIDDCEFPKSYESFSPKDLQELKEYLTELEQIGEEKIVIKRPPNLERYWEEKENKDFYTFDFYTSLKK